jgi:glycosyl-4,4'-diaponeurosporenoate acyltransferase
MVIVLDVVAWAAIHAAAGYLVHRMPAQRFERDRWLWRERRFERGGRLYTNVFRIKRWKHWLPEAGALFAGGFDKRSLRSRSIDYMSTYLRETRRAELGHWLAIVPAPLFFVWNPPLVGAFMVLIYAPAVNGPCILSQRFNRIRLSRVLSRARRPA